MMNKKELSKSGGASTAGGFPSVSVWRSGDKIAVVWLARVNQSVCSRSEGVSFCNIL
ncbi:MAG: hypothetical protein KME30_03880 [Iphinoe sp. HA4291-MV1]|nr:hypothetical protein [Iphinoe sp. HA4291-MV1]